MEVEKLVSICRVYLTAVRHSELLLVSDSGLCNQMSNLGKSEVATFFGRLACSSCGDGLEVVHSASLVDWN